MLRKHEDDDYFKGCEFDLEGSIMDNGHEVSDLLEYAKDLMDGGTEKARKRWVYGADDSVFDYIPAGLEVIELVAFLVREIHQSVYDLFDDKNEEWKKDLCKRVEERGLPCCQDCTDSVTRERVASILLSIGYDKQELIEFDWVDEEE